MKKIFLCLLATFMFSVIIPEEIKAATDSFKTETPADSTVVKNIIGKLKEIKNPEQTFAINSEKKTTHKEIRTAAAHALFFIGLTISLLLIIVILVLVLMIM
jgi:hypothetical protein